MLTLDLIFGPTYSAKPSSHFGSRLSSPPRSNTQPKTQAFLHNHSSPPPYRIHSLSRLTVASPASSMAIKAPKLTDRQFKFFPKLPPEIRLMVWRHALPKPRTITITSTDFTTRGERGWPVRNNRVSHNAQNVPCILHACPESRRLALKAYQLAFGRQLRQQPIYFNFQTDVLLLADESAIKSFFGGINEFEAFGIIGDLKRKVRHLAIGGYLGCGKIWDQLGELESLKTLILQRLKPGYGFSNVMVEHLENLEVKWQIRIESNHVESQEQSAANGVRARRGLINGMPEIQWLTEAKLR